MNIEDGSDDLDFMPNDFPAGEEYATLLSAMGKESLRGRVLLACSFLDNWLAACIYNYLLDDKASRELLDGFNAPLSTFSSRIKACRALGLITKQEYSDLNKLRELRNFYAHTIHTPETGPEIKAFVKRLSRVAKVEEKDNWDPEQVFYLASVHLLLLLLNRPAHILRNRLEEKNFPAERP